MPEEQPKRVKWRHASWEARGKRIGLWIFLAFAAWFIVSTVVQIGQGVFLADAQLPRESVCRERLLGMTRAVDRASALAAREPDKAEVGRLFEASLAPEWDSTSEAESICKAEARGADTYIEVLRLRDASQRSLTRGAEEYGGLRRSLARRLDAR